MSLTVYGGSVPDQVFAKALQDPMSISAVVISVLILIISVRGVLSLIKDTFRILSYFFKTKHQDKEIQTEPYMCELPAEIFFNSGSGVYHFSGCHHIGVRATSKAVCTFCKNRF